jgi:hypothetical protein
VGNRKHQRVKTILPVRITGSDSAGNRFLIIAHTLDISDNGARLGGVVGPIGEGDIIELQYQHRKAKCQVQWITTSGEKQQAGVSLIEANKDLWGTSLVEGEYLDAYEPPRKGGAIISTRKTPRYEANASVDLVTVPDHRTLSGQLQNISLGGCYVKTFEPLEVHTKLELLIQLDGVRINTFGVVRSCHAARGMGLKFTGFRTAEDEVALSTVVAGFAGEKTVAKQKKASASVSEKLQKVTKELYEVEETIKSAHLDPGILREFREAVGQVRSTSWAVQRYFEVGENQESSEDVLAFLNTERIRLAVRMCQHLSNDLKRQEIGTQSPHLAGLLEAVENLFTRLAGFEFKVVETGAKKAKAR